MPLLMDECCTPGVRWQSALTAVVVRDTKIFVGDVLFVCGN